MFCPKCAEQVPDSSIDCPHCKYHIQAEMEKEKSNEIQPQKSIGGSIKVMGFILVICFILGAIFAVVFISAVDTSGSPGSQILYVLLGIVGGFFSSILIAGFGELIENTFETKELLKQICINQENDNK